MAGSNKKRSEKEKRKIIMAAIKVLKEEKLPHCEEFGIGCYQCDFHHMLDLLESHAGFYDV